MKLKRRLVPALGFFALILLFLSLPESPNVFGWFGCKTCSSSDPYLPLIGGGYFSLLIVASLLFPAFPNKHIARGGFIWSLLLAGVLTFINLPDWCVPCLMGHISNILIWTIWMLFPATQKKQRAKNLNERVCIALFAPIATIALFSCLNLTFREYGFQMHSNILSSGLVQGDQVPVFSAITIKGDALTNTDMMTAKGVVINFVSPTCSYCKEQLVVVNEIASQLQGRSYRFINICSSIQEEVIEASSSTEWIEDKESKLQHLFKVSGYPTMFVVGLEGIIIQVIQGVPDELKSEVIATLGHNIQDH